MNANENDPLFGEVIYTYTRAHAIADGFQVDATATTCGALDFDNPTPAITIAMPDDD